jgi:hypothetical protein
MDDTIKLPPFIPTTLCRSCGASVFWRTHVVTNKRAPIDARANSAGNIVLEGESLYRIASEPTPGVLRYTNHFQTCPQAKGWEK